MRNACLTSPVAEKSAEKPAAQTAAQTEVAYLRRLIEKNVVVTIKIKGGEEVSGVIECYDTKFHSTHACRTPELVHLQKRHHVFCGTLREPVSRFGPAKWRARRARSCCVSTDGGFRVEYKSSGTDADLVTEADRTSERHIVERLRARFPDHDIVAEEGGGRETGSEYRWYIDPLDGTTNFAHHFPVFCVSIGLEKAGEMIAGVVFDPTRNEMFTAEHGGGAFLNNKRIHVSKVNRLLESLTATGFPSTKRKQSSNIHFYHQVTMASHGVRRPGAAALDLCSVAAGRLEGFWEFRLSPWDTAAGKLMVEEAGGRLSDMHGANYHFASQSIVASNGLIHAELLETFAKIFRGEYAFPLPPMSG